MNCIFPDCTIKRYSRGLCLRHYSLARNLVRTGDAKWFLAPTDQNTPALIPPIK